uniref:Bestrophin homolog n=1 Tax=Steinernema glaseri TaxID=37863 RepID=A0A1I7Z9H3_9BILA
MKTRAIINVSNQVWLLRNRILRGFASKRNKMWTHQFPDPTIVTFFGAMITVLTVCETEEINSETTID